MSVVIEDLISYENYNAGIAVDLGSAQIRRVRADGNLTAGLSCISDCHVTDSSFSFNRGSGVHISKGLVSGSVSSYNGTGFNLLVGGVVLRNSTAINNRATAGGSGHGVAAGAYSVVFNVEMNLNQGHGYIGTGPSRVLNSTAMWNGGQGFNFGTGGWTSVCAQSLTSIDNTGGDGFITQFGMASACNASSWQATIGVK